MKISKILLFMSSFLISLLWTTLANENLFAQTGRTPSEIGTNHAFIIGIEKYDDPAWGSSNNSVKDANTIAAILKEKYNFKPENITLLTDETREKPDRRTIADYFSRYISSLTENDNLLIYYSGHSKEDEDGESYWVPRDGFKEQTIDWLKHEDLCKLYLESEDLQAKNVIIITDSPFSKNLLRPIKLPLEPHKPQYKNKILYQAKDKSRQVIAFGEKRTEPNKKYDGLSMFTYYVHKTLDENWWGVIDFQNLIARNNELIREAGKVAGTRIVKGKLKETAKEMNGTMVIACVKTAPPINITKIYVTPGKDEAGKEFHFEATTDRPAYPDSVSMELGGKKLRFRNGEDTKWKLSTTINSIGTFELSALAVNEANTEGEKKTGTVETMIPAEGIISVVSSTVTPEQGKIGEEYSFRAKTDYPAIKVNVIISGRSYSMDGSGTDWSLKRNINDYGNISYSVIAVNEKDIEGLPLRGSLLINAPEIKILKISTSEGYAGDLFTIQVRTDYEPGYVELTLDGKNYKMQGARTNWHLRREFPEIGKKSFTVTAVNTEGGRGIPDEGTLIVEERPPGIPDIVRVAFSPPKPQAGTDFMIKVDTKEEAKQVFLEIGENSLAMTGSGKEWRYLTKIASTGKIKYEITAENKNGVQGKKLEGILEIAKKEGIEIEEFTVVPSRGYPGNKFTWKAVTAEPAESVNIRIDDKLYPMEAMEGSNRNWTYAKTIDNLGLLDTSAKAKDRKGKEGAAKTASLRIEDRIASVIAPANTKVPQSPNSYAGEDFIFEVQTDNPAESVTIDLNGSLFKMTGSKRNWKYTVPVNQVGLNEYSIIARNKENKTGTPLRGKFEAKYAVVSAELNPEELYVGDEFSISATVNAPAEEAFIEIDSRKTGMTGAGSSWDYKTSITTTGTKDIKITAVDKDGKTSVPMQKTITIMAPPVNVAETKVTPLTDLWVGGTFTFKATTDKNAEKVVLSLPGNDYPMKKSGNEWTTTIRIKDPGEINYSVAAYNKTDTSGRPFTGSIKLNDLGNRYIDNKDGTLTDKLTNEKVQRYIDNGDDTITDRYAGLMMFKSPLRYPKNYDGAEKYIKELKNEKAKGFNDWRLPTAEEWSAEILDRSQKNPALPPGNPFKNVEIFSHYWSKQDHKSIKGRKYVADLYEGKISSGSRTENFFVWPVRAIEID